MTSSPDDLSRSASYASSSTEPTQISSSDVERHHSPYRLAKSPEAFRRWRPSYHFQAPQGWMNDPCAPSFDLSTGLYHVGFQWSPDSHDWHKISWGHAVASDLLTWNIKSEPNLVPEHAYDQEGVFTGCMIAARDGSLTCPYTSVSSTPIHHTLRHVRGSESLSLAKSFDKGRTWTKIDENPILPNEPSHLNVTGWRDPYVAEWPQMCELLGLDPKDNLFGIISGGIRDVTPTTFLYSIDANDLRRWSYVGPLANFGLNYQPSRWSGDLGRNWEVTNFCTIADDKAPTISRDFLIMGTEGLSADGPATAAQATGSPSRPIRGQLWSSGSLRRRQPDAVSGPVEMSYEFGGHLDHGCLYAANSFFDPSSGKQIVWGWIPEDDLGDSLRHAQGWSGLLSLPREISIQTLQHVVGARSSPLPSITSVEAEADGEGTYTVRTLASLPVSSVVGRLRQTAVVQRAKLEGALRGSSARDLAFMTDDVQTTQWELDCSFRVSSSCRKIGVSIVHSRDFSQTTTLSFAPQTETFTLDRPSFDDPRLAALINSSPEKAPQTLFTIRDPITSDEQSEPLRIRAWRDNSVLEVFVNERTAISTRLYAAEETVGIRFFADEDVASSAEAGNGDASELLFGNLWDGIGVPAAA